jgi:peptidoglycan/LPS O-acetylase OafA/YrhL
VQYRSDIDGLRALAVAPIVLFHAHVPGFDGGYVGVDIFFVISGFLITTILAEELAQGRFSFAGFYARRIRRLLPALIAMLAVVSILAPFVLLPDDLAAYARSVVAKVLLSSNILFWSESGYFDVASELKPLLHIWSLSIEEQFYLVFPLLLFGLHRWGRRPAVAVIVLLALSLAASIYFVRVDPSATFYLLPTRAWEFLIGSVLALGLVRLPSAPFARDLVAAGGVALILTAIFTFDQSTTFPGAMALVPCLGTALIILAGGQGRSTLVGRALGFGGVVMLGRISYSVYLWHWPIAVGWVYLYGRPAGFLVPTALVAGSLIVGALSWRFVEVPFRGVSAGSRRSTFVAAGGAVALFALLGMGTSMLLSDDGRIARIYGPDVAAIRATTAPVLSRSECIAVDRAAIESNGCRLGDRGVTASVALIGDSFADVLAAPLGERLAARGLSGLPFVFYSCPSILGTTRDEVIDRMPGWVRQCRSFWETSIAAIKADPAIRTVVMSNNYDWYLRRLSTLNGRPLLSADGAPSATTIQVEAILRQLETTILELAAAGKTIIFVGTSPSGRDDFSGRAMMLKLMQGRLTADQPMPATECRDLTAELGERLSRKLGSAFVYVDLAPVFIRGGACFLTKDLRPLTTDGSHLAAYPVAVIIDAIDKGLQPLAP